MKRNWLSRVTGKIFINKAANLLEKWLNPANYTIKK